MAILKDCVGRNGIHKNDQEIIIEATSPAHQRMERGPTPPSIKSSAKGCC